jgi:hypothetical protein
VVQLLNRSPDLRGAAVLFEDMVVFSRRKLVTCGRLIIATLILACAPARAQDAQAVQSALAAHIQRNPQDYEATFRYVTLCTEIRDYEAAIGALERLLMFNPHLSRAEKTLGFLYARLGAYGLAAEHLHAALADGDLDAVQRAQIQAQLPEIEKQTETSRLSVRLQTGLRAQSNANFFPTNNLFQVGGIGLPSARASRQGDINAFQLVQAAHDYEFGGQNGDRVETRVTAYATEQFRLPQYSVTLFGGSVGPRFFIPQNFINAFSVRPYLTGAVSTLGSTNYLNAGGGGVGFRGEFAPGVSLEPGVELRSLWVNRELNTGGGGYFPFGFRPYSTLSTIATGDVVTGYVAGNYALNDWISFEGRGAYSRANANFAPQSSDQVDLQSMVKFDIDPPNVAIPRRWTVGPYGRFTHLAFDAANPLVNPFIARRDAAWTGGVLLDAPITEMFGFAGNVEYSRNISNISNFSMQNLSVSFGPTAKF